MGSKLRVLVCRGPDCGDLRHSSRVADEFHRLINDQGLDNIQMGWQSCFGRCSKGPNVLVRTLPAQDRPSAFVIATPPPTSRGGRATMYNQVTPRDVAEIVETHLVGGRPVRRLMEHANQRPQVTSDPPKANEPVVKKDGDT